MDLDPAAKEEEAPTQWTSITGQPLKLDTAPSVLGRCTAISSYEKLNQLGEGTYGIVHRARSLTSQRIVALKQVRIAPSERQNGIPITALREISILRSLKHPNIVNVEEVAVSEEVMEEIYMVMEYAEQDLANLLDELHVRFTLSQAKCLFKQLLEGVEYLHRNDIIHRDLKMQNLLLTSKGILKIADFGMARIYSPRPLTPGVVTIWYRAPELLLGTKYYTPSIDLWSAGLVLAELLLCAPCLTGETPIEQLALTVKLLGSPSVDDLEALSTMGCPQLIRWQKESLSSGRADNLDARFTATATAETVDFLRGLLKWDPRARWSASEALGKTKSRYAAAAERWWKESPRAVDPALLPTFPEVRNGVAVGVGKASNAGGSHGGGGDRGKEKNHSYVFDFEGENVLRPAKRRRAGS